jgi:hypothetical protein
MGGEDKNHHGAAPFGFFLIRVRMLSPKSQMTEDPFYELQVIDEDDNLHLILSPLLLGKHQAELMFALRVGAAHPGESFVQVTTPQVFLDHFIHHRPKEPILLFTMLIIPILEISIVMVQYLPQGGIGRLSWVMNWGYDSHKSPFAEGDGKLVPQAWAD